MVRQLAEKAIEHNSKQYFVCVDLHMACSTREKLGVPEDMIQMVKSFHDDATAEVRVNGKLLKKIEVTNGLRLGCMMAPILFNIYASVVAE